jgi:hypothetical protein
MLEMRDAGIGSAQCGMPMGRSVRLVASMRDGDGTRYTGLGVVRPKFLSRWLFRVLKVMVVVLAF